MVFQALRLSSGTNRSSETTIISCLSVAGDGFVYLGIPILDGLCSISLNQQKLISIFRLSVAYVQEQR